MTERTLEQALANVERIRAELPHLLQPEVACFDMILLADELARYQEALGYAYTCACIGSVPGPEYIRGFLKP